MKRRLAIILLLFLAAAAPALGATRFYLPSSGAPGAYPSISTFWTNTTGVSWVRMPTARINSSMQNKQTASASGSGYFLNRIYVSDPIGAQTISGNVYGYLRAQAQWSSKSWVIIKVISVDGLVTRGTLYSGVGSNTWITNTLTSRGYPLSTAVAPVTALEGDRIVIEIGAFKNDGADFAIINSFGDNSATDLPQNETTTAANNPWLEFSMNISPAIYTRFYLPSTGAAPVAPAFSPVTWVRSIEADRLMMVRSKVSSSFTSKIISPGSATGRMLNRQYISEPLKAQTISGRLRGQLRARKTAGPSTSCYNIVSAKVVSGDGSTVRGYLINQGSVALGLTYISNQWTNRAAPRDTAINTITAQEGDRLVVEIGLQKVTADNISMQQEFGDSSAGDLPIDESTTSTFCPWIEFLGDIRMGTGGGVMII